jgi:hypothetical protein
MGGPFEREAFKPLRPFENCYGRYSRSGQGSELGGGCYELWLACKKVEPRNQIADAPLEEGQRIGDCKVQVNTTARQ